MTPTYEIIQDAERLAKVYGSAKEALRILDLMGWFNEPVGRIERERRGDVRGQLQLAVVE